MRIYPQTVQYTHIEITSSTPPVLRLSSPEGHPATTAHTRCSTGIQSWLMACHTHDNTHSKRADAPLCCKHLPTLLRSAGSWLNVCLSSLRWFVWSGALVSFCNFQQTLFNVQKNHTHTQTNGFRYFLWCFFDVINWSKKRKTWRERQKSEEANEAEQLFVYC